MREKVLILQNELSAYNVPVYNVIGDSCELTLGFYLQDKSKEDCLFKKHHFTYKKIGPFVFVKGLIDFAKQFDVVCIIPDMHVVSYCILPFLPRRYKVTNWSIGFRCSYVHPYVPSRKHIFADKVFQCILSHCESSIFYMEKSKEFWKDTNLDVRKVFIAPNTTKVLPINIDPLKKRNFLFVGTLYKGKGLDLLLHAYKQAVEKGQICNKLHIVGDGQERSNIVNFIKENNFGDKIVMHGAIFDEVKLAQLFSEALICISPTQGGLSVPKSMGYGVPFITRKDAITGGEVYHITPDVNGIIYEKNEDLTSILLDAAYNSDKYIEMGRKAKDYYDNHATIKHMALGAMEAFEFALNH